MQEMGGCGGKYNCGKGGGGVIMKDIFLVTEIRSGGDTARDR